MSWWSPWAASAERAACCATAACGREEYVLSPFDSDHYYTPNASPLYPAQGASAGAGTTTRSGPLKMLSNLTSASRSTSKDSASGAVEVFGKHEKNQNLSHSKSSTVPSTDDDASASTGVARTTIRGGHVNARYAKPPPAGAATTSFCTPRNMMLAPPEELCCTGVPYGSIPAGPGGGATDANLLPTGTSGRKNSFVGMTAAVTEGRSLPGTGPGTGLAAVASAASASSAGPNSGFARSRASFYDPGVAAAASFESHELGRLLLPPSMNGACPDVPLAFLPIPSPTDALPPSNLPRKTSEDELRTEKRKVLLGMYRDFVAQTVLHGGATLDRVSSGGQSYYQRKPVVVSLAASSPREPDDIKYLRLDESDGRLVEFPLRAISDIYRLQKQNLNLNTQQRSVDSFSFVDNIVVVEFLKRKLAFAFADSQQCQKFIACLNCVIKGSADGSLKRGVAESKTLLKKTETGGGASFWGRLMDNTLWSALSLASFPQIAQEEGGPTTSYNTNAAAQPSHSVEYRGERGPEVEIEVLNHVEGQETAPVAKRGSADEEVAGMQTSRKISISKKSVR
eukprot:g761.t1